MSKREFSTDAAAAAYWEHIATMQSRELDAMSARLRAVWIERDRLKALLTAHGVPIGTPAPESVPIINSQRVDLGDV